LIKSLESIQFKRFIDQLEMAKKRINWRLNKLINRRQPFKGSTWWVKTNQKEGHSKMILMEFFFSFQPAGAVRLSEDVEDSPLLPIITLLAPDTLPYVV
jgi:hypothetical protein